MEYIRNNGITELRNRSAQIEWATTAMSFDTKGFQHSNEIKKNAFVNNYVETFCSEILRFLLMRTKSQNQTSYSFPLG